MRAAYINYTILFILFHFLLPGRLLATDYPPIAHLEIGQGLSNNSVRCIYQDHNGFMWFGTYDGLNRYDGYEFKVFRNQLNNPASLPHNYIYAINEDQHHKLWIGTGQGVCIYNNLTSTFLPAFYIPYATKRKEKITVNVTTIETDAKGNVLIGTNGQGLLVQANGADAAIQLPIKSGGKLITDYNISTIKIDSRQRIWLFIINVGLCMYDPVTKEIRLVNDVLKSARCIEAGNNDNLWIGTSSGLYSYAIASHSLIKTYTGEPGKLTSNNIASLYFDKLQQLWIGTEGGGINILHTKTGKISYLLPGESKHSLSSESVFAIYEDKESRKWIGTLKGGINIIDGQKNQFHTITHDPFNSNSLINNFAASFYEDKDKNLWIGTDGGGMSIWDRHNNRFTNFKHDPDNIHSLSNNSVTCIRQDYLNSIWIATFGGGINKFNRATGTFEHFKCINEATGQENKNVWLLLEDRDKNLWATTFAQGKLYRFNRLLNRFEAFDQQLNDLIAITEDRSGALWAGDAHQLIKIDKQNERHTAYEMGKPVRAIYEDKKGNFWVGTEGGGLILFNRQQGKITTRYSDIDGLCNNSVLNILEDDKGQLWLSTFNGLCKFNIRNKTFKNFYQDDGLQSNQFLYSAALRLQSGELVFGGINGFNLFFPDSIRPRNYMPSVLLTGLRINNKPVDGNKGYIVQTSDAQISELKIPYNEAVLSFDFAALEYSARRKIAYAYYLEGWDKGWNYTGNVRTANYTNIREGNYILRIRSTNAAGIWNTKETILKITILPPWYRTWWAYLFYLFLAGGLIYLYLGYKARQARLEYEIKVAHLNAEKEREINEKKLSFFTNVSHEFRTPLTLIINPIKDLLQKDADTRAEDNELNIIYRNARRLLSLVDQLLLFRKADTGADTLNITKLNFYNLCHEVYLAFVQQAKAKQIDYLFEGGNPYLELYADREKMEIILYNLISNALKYTSEGGKVVFSIAETQDDVQVSIADNGYGISDQAGNQLFEKFYQVKEEGIPLKPGFGIGLYLVKQFVERHKGAISYKSELGKGTTFFIKLHKGKDQFDNQPIVNGEGCSSVMLEELLAGEAIMEEQTVIIENKNELNGFITENQSILVIDDSAPMRQYIAQIFSGKFAIYEAASAEDGLKLARQYLPDMIISDVLMQGISGVELVKSIKEDPALNHIPVILVTGSSSAETKLKGVECGADDYITKPFEKEILIARVANLLKSRNNLQRYFYNEITLQQNNLKISAEYKEFLDKCIAIVERHLDDDTFTIKTLAAEICMSHSNIYKKVKSISGLSVNGFIRFIRLRKAAELLITTNLNISETAQQVGINDIKYFREQFHKLFGMNPSEYIKKYREAFSDKYRMSKSVLYKE